jgi:hypothetical protein
MDAVVDYETPGHLLYGGGGIRNGTVEEKWSTVSGVIQCFYFVEKRGKDNACFEMGKEHARQLLVPSGDERI